MRPLEIDEFIYQVTQMRLAQKKYDAHMLIDDDINKQAAEDLVDSAIRKHSARAELATDPVIDEPTLPY